MVNLVGMNICDLCIGELRKLVNGTDTCFMVARVTDPDR